MLQGMKILAVDDDEMSLAMLTTMLGRQGVHCWAATNGSEAMIALESNPEIDILLLDLQMPIMDGFAVLAQCKRNPYLSNIPIIVLAADLHEKLKSLKLGADDFIAKPYNFEELELRISKHVQSRRLAESAKRAKNEFLAIASHELRTPMHQITGLADILDTEDLGNEQHELIGLLKLATGNLTGIIRDILNYVQLDDDTPCFMSEPFSLRTTVQTCLDSQKDAARERNILLECDIADTVSDDLIGPSFYVSRVFNILIENAVKFSFKGEVRIAILEESFGAHYSRFNCSVNDRGISIPEAFKEKIFEPFVQVDSSKTRKFEGIGLGLAIAKRMVELMGGTISVQSIEGMGSSFNFSFYCQRQGNPMAATTENQHV